MRCIRFVIAIGNAIHGFAECASKRADAKVEAMNFEDTSLEDTSFENTNF